METTGTEATIPATSGKLLPWLRRHGTLTALLVSALVFLVLSLSFLFAQDDAFITFRYVQNLLHGRGLVYNSGEYVEGYTTFLWTMVLALPAAFGGNLILFSHLLGIAAGLGALFVLYVLSRSIAPSREPAILPLVAVALTSTNPSFAYWTASGMETPLFTLLLVAGVLSYVLEYPRARAFLWTPILFILLSLTRPEGMLLFGLTAIHAAATSATTPKARRLSRAAAMIVIYCLPMAAFTLWRLAYYGYAFPNTFYAKAGLTPQYLSAGIEYTLQFARTYLFFGILFVLSLALVLWRRRTWQTGYLVMLLIGYCLSITLIGGDVLQGHRFFVPILPLIYVLIQEAFAVVISPGAAPRTRSFLPVVATAAVIAGAGLILGLPPLRSSLAQETALVDRMAKAGRWLKALPSSPTVAATTIGALGYYSEAPLIDMLGLTDTTIAHHPEYVEGLSSNWKERRYNTSYLLGRKPDWIFFSTDVKPSAFAERALFTRAEFRRWYYPCYIHLGGDFEDIKVAYRRASHSLVAGEAADSSSHGVEFIEAFNRGFNARRSPGEALQYFLSARETAPGDFALLDEQIGNAYYALKDTASALEAYQRAIRMNPAMVYSRIMLAVYARDRGNLEDAHAHLQAALTYNPEYSLPWTLLAENRALAGDTLSAVRFFTEALRIAPNNTEASRHLSRLQNQPRTNGGQYH